MKITVHYMAHLKQAAGVAAEEIELAQSCTAAELVQRLADQHGDGLRRLLLDADNQLQPTILLFVNDNQVSRETDVVLKDGDEVSFLSPIAGG